MKETDIYDIFTNFLTKYNDHFLDNKTLWLNKLSEVESFINKHGYKPSEHSKNNDVKTLGAWIGTQQQQYKNKLQIMKETDIYDMYTNFLTQYNDHFIDNKTIWLNKLSEVETYINKHGCRPSESNKINDTKTLGTWLSQQQQNYKNKTNIMKDQDIYNTYSQFLKKYSKYFNTK